MKQKLLSLLMALPLVLAACGGGNDEPVADPLDAVPASASQSPAGMTDYLRALTAAQSETREPVAIEGFDPPKPEDVEPDPMV